MFAPPRRFSQLAAAFIAPIRQGIRRKPCSRLTILSLAPDAHRRPSPLPFAFQRSLHLTSCTPLRHKSRDLTPFLEIRRFELLTSSLQSWRSSQLSYIPVLYAAFNRENATKKKEGERGAEGGGAAGLAPARRSFAGGAMRRPRWAPLRGPVSLQRERR